MSLIIVECGVFVELEMRNTFSKNSVAFGGKGEEIKLCVVSL